MPSNPFGPDLFIPNKLAIPPDQIVDYGENWRAIELWAKKNAYIERATFQLDGVVAGYQSPKWRVLTGGGLIAVFVDLVTAGGTATTVRILKNGAQLGPTATIAAGGYSATPDMRAYFAVAGDVLQMDVTAAGAGAFKLSMSVAMRG